MTLEDHRNDIDRIDKQIIELLEERFTVSEKIGDYKRSNGLRVFDPTREKSKLVEIEGLCSDEKQEHIKKILGKVMEESRKFQAKDIFDWRANVSAPDSVTEAKEEAAGNVEYGLLGKGLKHSYSKEIHESFGEYEYGYFDKAEDELEDFFAKRDFLGISVTAPYKQVVIGYCDEISDTAKACNSVNTIVKRRDGTLYGDNTDYYGFRMTVELSGIDIRGCKVLVLGSGGVSGTVTKVLEDLGAENVVIVSRQGENNYDNIDMHSDAQIIVNATPVGMFPDVDKSPMDLIPPLKRQPHECSLEIFTECKAVFDLIYNPVRTKLLLDAKRLGIPVFGGSMMLVAQAAQACCLFVGKDITKEDIEALTIRFDEGRKNIVLIGMPGSGKSTFGKKIAALSGRKFCDTDEIIETMEGQTPEEIILTNGEDHFRMLESKALRKAIAGSADTGSVIACGGGIVEDPDNYYVMARNGEVIYLERPLESLCTDNRPVSQRDGVAFVYSRRKDKYESWSDEKIVLYK